MKRSLIAVLILPATLSAQNAPHVTPLAGVTPVEEVIATESTLPQRHRALLGLRTAWLTRSNYLWAHRAILARKAGLTDADLRRIAQGPDAPGWDPFEATLLRSADELHVDSFIADATWTTLSARYDLPQMIDTIDTSAGTTMYAGLFNSLGDQQRRRAA